MHRTSLEKQKQSLMGEVSYLKLKLADMEGKHRDGVEKQHKAEVSTAFKHPLTPETDIPWSKSFFLKI